MIKDSDRLEGEITQRTHPGKKSCTCNERRKSFPFQSELRRHQRCHTGEEPHECNECGRVFAHISSLNKSENSHWGKALQVQQVWRAFSQSSSLVLHYTFHTGEKPYKCNECGRALLALHPLLNIRKVTLEKSYEVSKCKKAFS